MSDLLLILLGLAGLFVGGEWLVRGGAAIALRFALPPLLIGLTVVGFGTSTPELLVSVDAAMRGVPDIAIGNVVGSNIANVLLIVGLTALVWPIRVSGGTLRRDLVVMLLAAAALIPLFVAGGIGRVTGAVLFAGLVGYLVHAYRSASAGTADEPEIMPRPLWKSVAFVAAGLVALLFGARFLVDGAVSVARDFGVSEAFIGVSIVAVGTSLPELATSLVAAFRRHSEIAIGNVIGSNIFNVLCILGVAAMIKPIPVAPRFATFDLPVMIAVSAVLAVLLLARPVIGRIAGAGLLVAYGGYLYAAF